MSNTPQARAVGLDAHEDQGHAVPVDEVRFIQIVPLGTGGRLAGLDATGRVWAWHVASENRDERGNVVGRVMGWSRITMRVVDAVARQLP